MPISALPDQLTEFSLPIDKKQPSEQRAVFLARFPTARQSAKLNQLIRKAASGEEDNELEELDQLLEALSILIVGWKNLKTREGVEITYQDSLDELGDILTMNEIWQLYSSALEATVVRENDLGKSASDSASNTESSANPATPSKEQEVAAKDA